jgi:branched-chain amino acid transport system permease protein
MHDLLVVVINGFFFGLVYGLFAVGLAVVYRGSRVLNFAHGEIGMIGTFAFDELWQTHGVPVLIALAIGIGLSAMIGAATDVLVIRPLREQPRINSLVATIALSALLLFYAGRRWGLRPRYTVPIVRGRGVNVGGITILPIQLLMLACAVLLVTGLILLYRYTSLGLRLRATAQDPFAAGQVGVNVATTSMITWAMGGAIAALCGILIASQVAFTVAFMTPLLVRGLTAALIGGLTNPTGAFVVGVVLGVGEGLLHYFTTQRGVVEVVLAGVILGLLLLRPAGLVRAEY